MEDGSAWAGLLTTERNAGIWRWLCFWGNNNSKSHLDAIKTWARATWMQLDLWPVKILGLFLDYGSLQKNR